MRVCFLASGGGGNLKFFHLALELRIIKNIQLFVIADRECDSISYSSCNNIESKVIKYNKKYNKELIVELNKIQPDIIVTTWHKIIDNEVVNSYTGKLINLHYSLLPSFAGLIGMETVKQAQQQNCQYFGVTCHKVDQTLDGGKIIAQAIVKNQANTEQIISQIFKKGCLILLNSILLLSSDNIINLNVNSNIEFSPDLGFDDDKFNRDFWKKLKEK